MNVEDKRRMFAEAYRVLAPGGRYAISHAARGPAGAPYYPLPWAREPSYSFLGTSEEFLELLASVGFTKIVPLAVSRWRERHPRIVLRVVEKVQVELLFGLLRGDFDFVIAQTEFYKLLDGLKQRVIFRDRLRVFALPKHPLFRVAEPTWADLAQFPWMCPMVGGRQRTVLEKLLAAEGIDLPQQLIECGSIDFTKALVAASDHLAMLPEHAAMSDLGENRLKPLAITVPALSRDIAVIFRERSALDASSRDLVRQIETVGADLSRERSQA
jgi:DNA-binding transcriptional LysR family regulator